MVIQGIGADKRVVYRFVALAGHLASAAASPSRVPAEADVNTERGGAYQPKQRRIPLKPREGDEACETAGARSEGQRSGRQMQSGGCSGCSERERQKQHNVDAANSAEGAWPGFS